jgi:hypothetical protein
MWTSFRPCGSKDKPLFLADFDEQEAANVELFAESLWSFCGFDLDQAWDTIDARGRKVVTLDEWLHGMKCIGFEGNGEHIFRGLDVMGLGRLRRPELDYVHHMAGKGTRLQHSAEPIRVLCDWVQKEFGSAKALLDKLDFQPCLEEKDDFSSKTLAEREKILQSQSRSYNNDHVLAAEKASRERVEYKFKLGVSDLAARLTALGYPGDSLHVARIAAKAGNSSQVLRGKLLGLLLGKRKGAPPTKGCEFRSMRSKSVPPKSKNEETVPWRPKRAWRDAVDTTSVGNDRRPACVRTYFSVPDKASGFSLRDPFATPRRRARSVSPKSRSASPRVNSNRESARDRSLTPPRRLDYDESGFNTSCQEKGTRFVWGSDNKELKEQNEKRKAWDSSLENCSEANSRKSMYSRHYFGDMMWTPVKEEMQRSQSMKIINHQRKARDRSVRAN